MEWKWNSTDMGSIESGTDRNQICWISFSGNPCESYSSSQLGTEFIVNGPSSEEPKEIIAQMRLYLPAKDK